MYDTVHFWLDRSNIPNDDSVLERLDSVIESTSHTTGEMWVVGNLQNLSVKVSSAGIRVKGSLSSFFFPNNSFTLNRHQVKEAIEKLSDELGLPMNKARVYRIDVSSNFIMEKPTSHYLSLLGECRYFKRTQKGNETVYYNNKGKEELRTLIFYNKEREMFVKNKSLPDVYTDSNLLRYESRWNTRLPQQLKEPTIIGETLHDSLFYRKLVRLWADSYFRINKKKTFKAEAMDKIKTPKDALEYVCGYAIGRLPPDELQQVIDELQANKVFENRLYYSRFKQQLKKLSSNEKNYETDELIRELDNNVKDVLMYIR